ncbi:ATP-dependent zinc protease family protein [Lysobacter enzymogenes]|uniref:ATP-dependent zinc protease family protein n=1 Tax=Lysobacter enzymogenes TaxID=69 RepID=UPI00099C4C2B|nr:RimK/LysX family protein [Lysobacter enzymogenes]UZW59722.1 RimK/LysX family protein [Lysobacter enzymogenes]
MSSPILSSPAIAAGPSGHAPIVLGWREYAALPLLGIAAVRAKIDTGARSSALHVEAQWRFVEAGAPWVGFRLRPGAAGGGEVEALAPVADERDVTDSGGHRTRRVFIRTVLSLAGSEREIDMNLADRRGMRFPMLLGRTAVAHAFTVDPARSFLHGRVRRRPPRA